MPTAVRQHIWVVDDSAMDVERVRRAIAQADEYEITTFADGSAALEALSTAEITPVLMVVDWVMPGVSGLDVCSFIKRAGSPHEGVAVLLLTGEGRGEHIVEGFAAGADDFVIKTCSDAELHARVAALVRVRQLLRRAEAAEELNRRLLESAPDAIIALDDHDSIVFANNAACTVLGVPSSSSHELHGKRIHDVVHGLPLGVAHGLSLEADTSAQADRDRLHDGQTLPDVRIGQRTFSPTARVLPTDTLARMTLSLRDVTERRNADARRLDFYSMIAHDLRSPLSAMMLRTDVMLRGQHGVLAPRVITDLRKIDESLRSLLAMINDFLDLARLENTTMVLERHDVDLPSLIARIVEDFRPLLDVNGLTWRAGGASQVWIRADKRRLTQALGNLIGNAVKFTPPGGSIHTDVAVSSDGDTVEISVADTGRGIAADALPTLFQRYTRAIDDEHEVAGTGLGLMIVKEIVEAHGGVVGVESTPGKGSRFWMRLPTRRAAQASAPAA